MDERINTHEIIDNEGSNIKVFSICDQFWVESEIFIIRDNKPLSHKTTAIVGPYSNATEALDSIPGKTTVKDLNG